MPAVTVAIIPVTVMGAVVAFFIPSWFVNLLFPAVSHVPEVVVLVLGDIFALFNRVKATLSQSVAELVVVSQHRWVDYKVHSNPLDLSML